MSQLNVKLNFKPSPKDNRDYHVKINRSKIYKALKGTDVDLSSFCTDVREQGSTGNCVAHAVLAAVEYNHKRVINSGVVDIYSERFTYFNARELMGWDTTSDSGCYIRDGLESLKKSGACPESMFPYNDNFSEQPNENCYKVAKLNQVVSYAHLDVDDGKLPSKLLQDCLAVLQSGHVIAGGFVCYKSLWSAVDGIITGPDADSDIIGGHAILICGFSMDKNSFLIKNSWGKSWGDKNKPGYGWLSFDYLLQGKLWDLWVCISQENNSDTDIISVEKPAPPVDNNDEEKVEFLECWAEVKNAISLLELENSNTNIDQQMSECSEQINKINRLFGNLQNLVSEHKIKLTKVINKITSHVTHSYELGKKAKFIRK